MPKMELDITIFVCVEEVIAEAGDRLMIFNNRVIGIIPRNDALPKSVAIGKVIHAPVTSSQEEGIDKDDIIAVIRNHPSGVTTRRINRLLRYDTRQQSQKAASFIYHLVRNHPAEYPFVENIGEVGLKKHGIYVIRENKDV